MDDLAVEVSAVEVAAARAEVEAARRAAAAASAGLAVACVRFAEVSVAAAERRAGGSVRAGGSGRVRPGELVAEEVALLLRERPWPVRCLLARSRRLAVDLPRVWAGFVAGEVDAEQVRVIDRVARRVAERSTLAAIDAQAVAAAASRDPRRLQTWLLRLVVGLEPAAFAERHRRALAERRVSVVQGADGVGYVTGEVSAADAAAIDAMLSAAARGLGAADPRTEQQRRADCFADLLLGRLVLEPDPGDTEPGDMDPAAADPRDADLRGAVLREADPRHGGLRDAEPRDADSRVGGLRDADPRDAGVLADPGVADPAAAETAMVEVAGADRGEPSAAAVPGGGGWLEVEEVDPDTGELLGTRWQRLDGDGHPVGDLVDRPGGDPGWPRTRWVRRAGPLRVGVVVALSSLLGVDDRPAELADRSGFVPAGRVRELITDALEGAGSGAAGAGVDGSGADGVLFTRLLTDDGGRLLDVRELGRFPSRRLAEAVRLRAGTCRFPTCHVPAARCDVDHHQPWPHGPTAAGNLDPLCRRHHRGKTFAWLAAVRDGDQLEWTMPDAHRYRCTDDPLPTGPPG